MDWKPIETIPVEMLDGREVMVKRVFPSGTKRVVAEGAAVFGVPHQRAPQRQDLGPDPLGRLSLADYDRESRQRTDHADTAHWLRPDRMYSFPTPTHWASALSDQPRPAEEKA